MLLPAPVCPVKAIVHPLIYSLIDEISDDLKEIMTKTVKFCHADDSIESTARRMRKLDISCLPVVDDDFKLKGIISTDQISHLVSEYR